MLDARGLIYVVDRLAGLDLLEFGGSTTGAGSRKACPRPDRGWYRFSEKIMLK
jgi:hypothetical protein